MRLNTKFFVEISDLPPRLPQGLPKDVNKCLLASFSQRQTVAVPEGLAADSSWRGYTRASIRQGPRAHDGTVICLPLLTPATSWGLSLLASALSAVVVMSRTPPPRPASRGMEGGPPLRRSCGPLTSSWEVEMGFLRSSHLGSLEGSERVQLSEPFSNLRVLSKLD